MPAIAEIEGIGNPKDRLDELLLEAAGRPTGRRGRNFRALLKRVWVGAGPISGSAKGLAAQVGLGMKRVKAFT